jgi:hypothetical protein
MEFRWAALIALWTFLSGPIFGGAPAPAPQVQERPTATPVAPTAALEAEEQPQP